LEHKMKTGDTHNWAYAILGIMMIYMTASIFILSSIAPDKYMATLALVGFLFWGGITSITVTGIFSIVRKSCVAILGTLFGIAMFVAICILSLIVFMGLGYVGSIFKMPNNIWRIVLGVFYAVLLLGVPIVSFGFAFFREPKEEFQQSAAPLPSAPHAGPSEGAC